ncbi:MAG: hypothetical protein HC893_06635 [Chloroflexaceae bacterium]|nr:hypothetical protein [Chloroflexaceae bacterium]
MSSQPTWEVEQRTYFPYEFGIWESTANKLAQSGSEEGQSLVETFLLAPPQVGTEAFIGTQIYPQGNQVIGILFGFTENGYYAYRVYRNAPHDPQRPGQLHLLEYYDATTMDYRVIAEKTTADGIPGFETGSWQELRVSLSGDRIRTSFHGTDVFDVEETQLREGKVGLLTLAIGEVLFDNFTVAQP